MERNNPTKPSYKAFLLRCTLHSDGPGGQPFWRYVLREVSPVAQEHVFTDWMEVSEFIAQRMKQSGTET